MNKKSLKKIIAFLLSLLFLASLALATSTVSATDTNADYYVDLDTLTYRVNGESIGTAITVYDDLDTFLEDYNNDDLPEIYITEFLFDGVGKVKKVSQDDDGTVTTKTISTTVINVNSTGSTEFSGTAEDTMIAVDTNGITKDITLILNGIDLTSSSSTPAIMIYNKDVTYSDCNVTISTAENTNNYISGGKLKKVSTMTSDRVSEYTAISSVYSDTSSEYYYIFSSDEVSNILYAQETADSEKISEGDPYTYYKYSGAIGADITVNFEGKGYLEVSSQGDEGIELKGNINFIGGTGDYKITSYDDGINASTTGTDIYIDVNSLYVSVNEDGDEGDAIDSNGTIHIEGGIIYAFAHATSQDDGIDSDQGTYINGGTVIATGNMADSVSDSSEQEFIKLNFAEQQSAGTTVYITDTNGNIVMAFVSDRTFTTLTYSSSNLEQTTYYVYKNGTVEGTSENGLYTEITSYSGGTQQQWSGSSSNMGDFGGNAPDPDNGGNQPSNSETPPDIPNGESNEVSTVATSEETASEENNESSEGSIEFTLSSSTHTFNNVTNYVGSTSDDNSTDSNTKDNNTSSDNTTSDNTTNTSTSNTISNTSNTSSTNTSSTNSSSTNTSNSSTDNTTTNASTTSTSSSTTSSSDSTNSTTDSADDTTATGTIPYTGVKTSILKIIIFILIIITVFCFIKYKSLED